MRMCNVCNGVIVRTLALKYLIFNNNYFFINTMKTKNLFEQEYVAPELEVISMTVEAGFSLSTSIDDAEEDNYGGF